MNNQSSQKENNIRLACWHLMVDLDLVHKGSYAVILPRLSEKMSKSININTLIMSLNGYRTGPAYQELLVVLYDLLKNWPQKVA